ncbi:MAG: tetratricopeptide repeat protein, partial [bacterium]|nr:tetratricopeptide repeat protein [bacterium]
ASSFYLSQLSEARTHFEQGNLLYDPQQHHALAFRYGHFDPGVVFLLYGGWTLWVLGYPDQALAWGNDGLSLAHNLGHPYTLARGLYWNTVLHQFRREWQIVQQRAEAAILVAAEHQIALVSALGPIMRGWALAMQGQGAEELLQIRQGIDDYRATGAEFQRPQFLAMLAEVYATVGRPEEALPLITEALSLVEKMGEHYYEAELLRLKGLLLLAQSPDNHPEAETCYQNALDIARQQQAKSWELRTATSLARLWQQQDKRQDAYDLLAPVYEWFTEGFDTADLQEAKALLQELEG